MSSLFQSECNVLKELMDSYEKSVREGKDKKVINDCKIKLMKKKVEVFNFMNDTINEMNKNMMTRFKLKNITSRRFPIKYRIPSLKDDIVIGSIVKCLQGPRYRLVEHICIVCDIIINSDIKPMRTRPPGLETEYVIVYNDDRKYRISVSLSDLKTLTKKEHKEYVLKGSAINSFAKLVKNHILYSPNTKFGKQFCIEGQKKLDNF